jgi:hypothetical protein
MNTAPTLRDLIIAIVTATLAAGGAGVAVRPTDPTPRLESLERNAANQAADLHSLRQRLLNLERPQAPAGIHPGRIGTN